MLPAALLDTDILSELLKKRNAAVLTKCSAYLAAHGAFSFSLFTLFEIERGLKEKAATQQLAKFATFCQHSRVLPLSEPVLHRAGDLWAHARQGGHPHGDADLIIAATAVEHGLVLITGNTSHFTWVPGLTLDNWRTP